MYDTIEINEYAFDQAVSYKNEAVSVMDVVTSSASAVLIPSGFSNTGEVRSILKDISSVIQPRIGDFSSAFSWMSNSIPLILKAQKEALDDRLVRDENGDVIGITTEEGYISLEGYKTKESDTGTFYYYVGGGDSGITNGCNIYIPKVEDIDGTVIAFLATSTVKQFASGEIKSKNIVIFPFVKTWLTMSNKQAKDIAKDAQNIAKAFGADPNNISVCGFSQGGSLAGILVNQNELGTFKTAIFGSTRYGIENVTDPNTRVIVLSGSRETENGDAARGVYEDFTSNHINDAEIRIIMQEQGMDAHTTVMPLALTSNQFDGQNVFDYASSFGANGTANGGVTVNTSTEPSIIDVSGGTISASAGVGTDSASQTIDVSVAPPVF